MVRPLKTLFLCVSSLTAEMLFSRDAADTINVVSDATQANETNQAHQLDKKVTITMHKFMQGLTRFYST